jgi:membrane-bound lytic murein transglycosylase
MKNVREIDYKNNNIADVLSQNGDYVFFKVKNQENKKEL